MRYDFDTPVVRRGTGCYKWDEETADGIIPMWVADMDFRTAPAIIEALQRRVEHGVFGYTLVPESYYKAVIAWFDRRHQWTIDRSWIQYTSGVVPALSVIVKAFTEPGDKVILQMPVYNCFFSSVRNNGCEVLENRLAYVDNRYEMDFDDLEQKASDPRARLLILCNPHNPTGRVWTREELARVYNICKQHGVKVVSDEIHNELTFRGRRYVPYGTVCQMDNAIICTSPSKSFNTAGLQIANIICADADWRARIDRAININEVCDVNPFGVAALQAAYNESEDWLDALCEYIYQNYETLCKFFATELPQLTVTPLEGTYLVWVNITALNITSDELTERLLKEGKVQVNSGTMYGGPSPSGKDNVGEGFIRLNIACPRAQMMEGLRRIQRVVSSL
jgi:cystathionine beta-lyase